MATECKTYVMTGHADVTCLEGDHEAKPKLTRPAMRTDSVQQWDGKTPSGSRDSRQKMQKEQASLQELGKGLVKQAPRGYPGCRQ